MSDNASLAPDIPIHDHDTTTGTMGAFVESPIGHTSGGTICEAPGGDWQTPPKQFYWQSCSGLKEIRHTFSLPPCAQRAGTLLDPKV